MERRELIQWLVASAGLRCLASLAPQDLLAFGRDVHRRSATGRALSAHALETITVAAERIIPATDTPGATDAGVAAFIDKMLADWHTSAEREQFLAGLADLERRDFATRSEAEQVTILTALDAEARAQRAGDHWFARLKYLTVYGYCTSEAGMRALGLFPAPWRYDGCAPVGPR